MNTVLEWLKKHPLTISFSIGFALIVGGLAFWIGLPQIMIVIGIMIVLCTVAYACEGNL